MSKAGYSVRESSPTGCGRTLLEVGDELETPVYCPGTVQDVAAAGKGDPGIFPSPVVAFPEGHVGYDVAISVDEVLQFFTDFQLQSTSLASSTQDDLGVVRLSTSLCTDFDCFEFAAVRAPCRSHPWLQPTLQLDLPLTGQPIARGVLTEGDHARPGHSH